MDKVLVQFINSFKTPIRIVEIDSQRRPVYYVFNNAALLDANLSHNDIVGRTAADLYPGVLGEIAQSRHLAVAKSGQALSYELEEDTPEGKQWYRTTLAPVVDDANMVQRIFCTQIDITAEKRMQSVESDAETRVREAEQYIALAAHDLRTPMRNVRMLAEYIQEDHKDLEDEVVNGIHKVEEIATNAMSLISDVLSHAQATEKRCSKLENFQFDDMCSKIISVLDPLDKSRLTCTTSTLIADKVTLQIAVSNLLDNALKHNDSNALQLSVSVQQKSTEFIEVTVTDNGKGLGESALAFLESGQIKSHSGFGLIGVSRLVRARGGEIRVDSSSDENGVVISFSLPGIILES